MSLTKRMEALEKLSNRHFMDVRYVSDEELKAYIHPAARKLQAKLILTDAERNDLAIYLAALSEDI